MKHGKKPTIAQRKLIRQNGLDCSEWLVVKDTPVELHIVHRVNNKLKICQM